MNAGVRLNAGGWVKASQQSREGSTVMNPELIYQLAGQRLADVCEEATRFRLAAVDRAPRESVRQRAGWALIKTGLKLTGPSSRRQHPRPRPAGL
jgi:hypothetical protein